MSKLTAIPLLLTFAAVSSAQVQPEPKVVTREAQNYVAIPDTVTMQGIGAVYPQLMPKIFAWLQAHNVTPAGPPFMRFVEIDMAKQLKIEVGIPVGKAVKGSDEVKAGVIPAGKYVALTWFGPNTVAGNAALQKWAKSKHIQFATDGKRWTSRVEFSLTDPRKEPDMKKWRTDILYLVKK